MSVIDLTIKATSDDPAQVPYSQAEITPRGVTAYLGRRVRIQAGEVVTVRNDADHTDPLNGYGLVALVRRDFRIIRIVDALDTDGARLMRRPEPESQDLITDPVTGIQKTLVLPRRRIRRIKLKDAPQSFRDQLAPRRFPDVDDPFWARARDHLLAKWPQLATAPPERRRSTPWDASLTRAQLANLIHIKPDEPRDLGLPIDDGEVDHSIDTGGPV